MRKIIFGLLLVAGIFTLPVACTKVVPEVMHYDQDSSRQEFGNVKLKKKKILLIGIDGAGGQVTKSLNPPVIKDLLASSIYTFDGLADTVTTVGTGWASLTTGVNYPNHQIKDSSLIPSSVKGSHAEIKYFDNFISIVKMDNIDARVTVITAWDDMTSFLLNTADNIINTRPADGDGGVETAALNNLNNSNVDILIVNFSAPAVAGLTGSFDVSNPDYSKAILDTDTRIGKLITAMKARKTFADEDWLVVIQSTGGGVGKVLGSRTSAARNTFSIYYSPRLVPAEFANPIKPVDNAFRFYGGPSNYTRAENADGGLYNVGNGALTIEAKVKFNKSPAGNYNFPAPPPFLNKVTARTGSTPGWSMFKNTDKITWYVADGTKNSQITTTKAIADGNWHTIAGVAYKQGNDYMTAFYQDGENKITGSIVGSTGSVASTAPMILGYIPNVFSSSYVDMYIADVRVWNTVLSDTEIKDWSYKTGDLSAHPKYANLIGYWSCLEGNGTTFVDQSPSKKNFTAAGPGVYSWDFMGDYFAPPSATPPQIIDVVPSVYYWLGITLEGAKKPVGKNWLTLKIQ